MLASLGIYTLFLFFKVSTVKGMNGKSMEIGNRVYHPWTVEEDAKVLEMYEQFKGSPKIWEKISTQVNRKSRLIRERFSAKLDPALKNPRSEWTEDEDRIILQEADRARIFNKKPKWAMKDHA